MNPRLSKVGNRMPVQVDHWQWHQFTVEGIWTQVPIEIDKYGRTHTFKWAYPEDLLIWLHNHMRGRWSMQSEAKFAPLFIEDRKDAMFYKLVYE